MTHLPTITLRMARAEDEPGITALIQSYVDEGKLLARTLREIDELLPNFFVAVTGGRAIGGWPGR